MIEQKIQSGRGGKREGAGRPIGTTGAYKEKRKKPCSFRLPEGEEKTVRAVLKDMRTENIYNYENYIKLTTGFKFFIEILKQKYPNLIKFQIFSDGIIRIIINKSGDYEASQIIDEIISYAKERLNKEYFCPHQTHPETEVLDVIYYYIEPKE